MIRQLYAKYTEFKLYLAVLNWKRILNLFRLMAGYWLARIVRKLIVWGQPYAVSIEPTTVCNLACPHCPTGNGSLGRTKGTLTRKRYAEVIEKLPDTVFHLNLYLQGEPLLNPHIVDFVQIANAKGLFSTLSTNGQLLDEKMADGFVNGGLRKIIISLDGLSQMTYKTYRVGGDINKVFNALRLLADRKSLHKSKTPLVELQFIVFAHNEHELMKLAEVARKYAVDNVVVKTPQIYDYQEGNVLPSRNRKLTRYIPKNGKLVIQPTKYKHCFRIWSSLVVSWNGDLAPCCYDKDMTHKGGNIFEIPFNKAWLSAEFQNLRYNVLTKRNSISICSNCPEGRGLLL